MSKPIPSYLLALLQVILCKRIVPTNLESKTNSKNTAAWNKQQKGKERKTKLHEKKDTQKKKNNLEKLPLMDGVNMLNVFASQFWK